MGHFLLILAGQELLASLTVSKIGIYCMALPTVEGSRRLYSGGW